MDFELYINWGVVGIIILIALSSHCLRRTLR